MDVVSAAARVGGHLGIQLASRGTSVTTQYVMPIASHQWHNYETHPPHLFVTFQFCPTFLRAKVLPWPQSIPHRKL